MSNWCRTDLERLRQNQDIRITYTFVYVEVVSLIASLFRIGSRTSTQPSHHPECENPDLSLHTETRLLPWRIRSATGACTSHLKCKAKCCTTQARRASECFRNVSADSLKKGQGRKYRKNVSKIQKKCFQNVSGMFPQFFCGNMLETFF